ncbi:MAG: SoxR reducing system RseC family protein [Magnetococcales bacterium]|nr:SoxR reducing system RseC family protein [Magnetococcales bacterium]
MMKEEGRVISIEQGDAIVATQRREACGTCHGEKSCGTLSMGMGNRETHIQASNPVNAEVGDRVVIQISERQFLRASFLIYAMPLIAFFVVGGTMRSILVATVESVAVADLLGAFSALAAMGGAFWWLRGYNSRLEQDGTHKPVISEIVYSSGFNVAPVSFHPSSPSDNG